MENMGIVIKSILAAFGGYIIYWLGGLDHLLTALAAVMVLDYVTGMLNGWHSKSLSSAVGFKGIVKKVVLLMVVALAFIIEQLTEGSFPLREMTILFFVVNESLSVLENAAGVGLPLPPKLVEVLSQLKGKHTEGE